MNDRAREALVAAALSGVKQLRFALNDQKGGYCAGGVLCAAAEKELGLYDLWGGCQEVLKWAEMTPREWSEMVTANNHWGWDFLTIARKIGVDNKGDD